LFSLGGTCTKKGVVLIFVLDPEGKILFNSSGGVKRNSSAKTSCLPAAPGRGYQPKPCAQGGGENKNY